MLLTTIAGSLPKPAWLAEPERLWAPWRLPPETLGQGQRDAVLAALKEQEAAGIDIVTDGEQSRQHFVHGFLERLDGIDFDKKVTIGIRADRYKAEVPTVTGPLARRAPVHLDEVRWARANTERRLKFTIPGPMTIVDTLADEHYRDRRRLALEFARIINEEARDLAAAGLDVLQLDEPAFNVYMDDVAAWGIEALHQAIEGVACTTAVHICYGYGIKANVDWKGTLGREWLQYEQTFPLLAKSRIGQVSLECANSRVPLALLGLLSGKDVLVGCIDVATEKVETPEDVAATFRPGLDPVPARQHAWAVVKDRWGRPAHDEPRAALVRVTLPVEPPGPDEALGYVLYAGLTYNTIFAARGVPISVFDLHDRDLHVPGSGAVVLVAALGSETAREGRLKVGELRVLYPGVSNLLSPRAGADPMHADFKIQGYETPDGSFCQFVRCQAPQLLAHSERLTLPEASSFMLDLETVYKALYDVARVEVGERVFIEGAAGGTGLYAVACSALRGACVTGLVSTEEKGRLVLERGGAAVVNRKDPALAG